MASQLTKIDFTTASVTDLKKLTIDSPKEAKQAISAGVHKSLMAAIFGATDLPLKLEFVRLLHDVITNDVEEAADSTIADEQLQTVLGDMLTDFTTIPEEYLECICNICFNRVNIGVSLIQKVEDIFGSDDIALITKYLQALAFSLNGMPFNSELHGILAEVVEEKGDEFISSLAPVLLKFYENGDFLTAPLLADETIFGFLKKIILAHSKTLLALPSNKDWLRNTQVSTFMQFLHYLSVVDFDTDLLEDEEAEDGRFTLLESTPEDEEEEEDAPAEKNALVEVYTRALSKMTNFKVELDEANGGGASAALASLLLWAKNYPEALINTGLFLQLVDKICSCDAANLQMDPVNAATIVGLFQNVLVLLLEEEAEERAALVDSFKRPSLTILRALLLVAPFLKDNSEGGLALCEALTHVWNFACMNPEEGGITGTQDRISAAFSNDKIKKDGALKKVQTLKPETKDEKELKKTALEILNL